MQTIAPPPARIPRRALDEPALTGKRITWAGSEEDMPGFVRYIEDYRAAGEVFSEAGREWVRIVPEDTWDQWRASKDPNKPPACPRARAWPAQLVWVI